MGRRLNVFLLVLTALLLAVYAYVGLRLTDVTWVRVLLAVPFAFVWIIPVVYWSGERRHARGGLDLALHYAGFFAMGWLSFMLCLTIVRDLILLVTGWDGGLGLVAGGSLAGVALGGLVAARGPRVRDVEVSVPGLAPELDGLRIAQISDLHVGPTIGKRYVDKVVRLTNALNADLVAITGDLMDGGVEELTAGVAPLGQLTPRGRVYFCTGNHEYYSSFAAWKPHLVDVLGMRVLANEHVVVPVRGGSVMVAGVDDPAARMADPRGGPDAERAMRVGDGGSSATAALFKILLAHNPKVAPSGARAGFDLVLSGHTHAGQFLPWTFVARMVHAPHFAGLSRIGATQIYVSAGTGSWGPPIRLGTSPEVTLLRLKRG